MAFSDFKNINMVLEKYPLRIKREQFIPDRASDVPAWFLENLDFVMKKRQVNENEFFACEVLIYPFLQEAWKRHVTLQLWIKQAIHDTAELSGEPDYLVSYIPNEAIRQMITTPLLAVVEAKQEKFSEGWGQCVAEMIACQHLNHAPQVPVYGIVTSGELWQFGKLREDVFTENAYPVAIENPVKILGALDYIFTECEQNIHAMGLANH